MNIRAKLRQNDAEPAAPIDVNPFVDALGILYALSFVAVAIAAYRTGMQHVVGALPLWAIVAAILGAGCVLMHSVRWSSSNFACPLAVTWSFLALWMIGVDLLNKVYPPSASTTPLADPMVLQWTVVVVTVGFGAAAVFSNFNQILKSLSKTAGQPPVEGAGCDGVAHVIPSVRTKP